MALPLKPDDLPVLVILPPKRPNQPDRPITDKRFTVRKNYLMEALIYLKRHNPEYKNITISNQNLEEYVLDNDILQNPPTVYSDNIQFPTGNEEQVNPETEEGDTTSVDIPTRQKTVAQNIITLVTGAGQSAQQQTNEGDNAQQQRDEGQNAQQQQQQQHEGNNGQRDERDHTQQHQQNQRRENQEQQRQGNIPSSPLNWPTREPHLASEFDYGYWSKTFAVLFPTGAGDITKRNQHPYEVPLLKWFQYLLQSYRRFAEHHLFVFVAASQYRRHKALTLSNIFLVPALASFATELSWRLFFQNLTTKYST